MRLTRTIVLILALVAGFVAFRFFQNSSDSIPPAMPQVEIQIDAKKPENFESINESSPASESIDDRAGCLTLDEFRAHPEARRVIGQLDSIAATGTDIETYRALDESTVRGFAEQGDSAAMVVVGAISVMRAHGIDESRAVDWLNRIEDSEDLKLQTQRLSPEAGLALNDAAYWFYQAALNGRVLALQYYGQVRSMLFGGPIGLGWISREEYESLERSQVSELLPVNLYRQVAFDLAPQLALLDESRDTASGSEIARRIRGDLVGEFNQTLAESELSPLNIPAAASPEFEALRARICASELPE